jgi:hypothetical protein
MASTKVFAVREGRRTRVSAASLDRLRVAPAPYQTRICARCGRETTFVREDAAGSWYSCVECGRYA